MTSYWRNAGLNYLQYSAICARLLRRALKPEIQAAALLKEETTIKVQKWKDGVQGPPVFRPRRGIDSGVPRYHLGPGQPIKQAQ